MQEQQEVEDEGRKQDGIFKTKEGKRNSFGQQRVKKRTREEKERNRAGGVGMIMKQASAARAKR
jgi:hypothetical protein